MKLYFQNSNGKERLVAEVNTQDEALSEIKGFCYERGFKIPYYRIWGDIDKDGMTIDVGSHVEFFILKNA